MANPSSKKEARDRRRKNREIFADAVNACFDSLSVNEHYTINKTNNTSIHPLVLTLSFKMYNFMKKIIAEIEASNLENDIVNIKSEEIINIEAEGEASELDEENEERDNSSRQLKSKPIRTPSTSARRQLDSQSRHQPANVPVPQENSNTNPAVSLEPEIKIESDILLTEAERLPSKSVKKRACPPAIPISAAIDLSKRPRTNNPRTINGDKGLPTKPPAPAAAVSNVANKKVPASVKQETPKNKITPVQVSKVCDPLVGSNVEPVNSKKSVVDDFKQKKRETKSTIVSRSSQLPSVTKEASVNLRKLPDFHVVDTDSDDSTAEQSLNQYKKSVNRSTNDDLFKRPRSIRINARNKLSGTSKASDNQTNQLRITRSSTGSLTKKKYDADFEENESECSLNLNDDDDWDTCSVKSNLSSTSSTGASYEEKVRVVKLARDNPSWGPREIRDFSGCTVVKDRRMINMWSKQINDLLKVDKWVYSKITEYKNNEIITDEMVHNLGIQARNELGIPKFRSTAYHRDWVNKFKKNYLADG